jgi:hemerythrin superfamily protein
MTDTHTRAKSPMQMLKQDHRTVKELFSEYRKLEESDREEKDRLFREINEELTIHAEIEERLFYPAVRDVKTDEAEDVVNEAVEEHHVVKTLLEELSALQPGEPSFDAKMKVLMENVEHHAEEEEKEMFPQAKRLPEETLDSLLIEMEALRNDLEDKDVE